MPSNPCPSLTCASLAKQHLQLNSPFHWRCSGTRQKEGHAVHLQILPHVCARRPQLSEVNHASAVMLHLLIQFIFPLSKNKNLHLISISLPATILFSNSFLSHFLLNPFPSGHHLNHSHFRINKSSDQVSTHILLDLLAACFSFPSHMYVLHLNSRTPYPLGFSFISFVAPSQSLPLPDPLLS